MKFKTLRLRDVSLKFAAGDTPTFEGYASVYGGNDDVGDTIEPGAYSDVLARDGSEVKMYYNHGWLQGELPIGKMFVREDERGLYVERAEFTPGIKLAEEVMHAVRHQTIDGLSVGISYRAPNFTVKANGGHAIKRIDRLKEISVVDFPADEQARIESVKAALDAAASLKEIEAVLRDAGRFSRADACALVARIKSLCQQRESAAEPPASVSEALSSLFVIPSLR